MFTVICAIVVLMLQVINIVVVLQAVDPLDDTSDEPSDSNTLQRHCTMEFFEACSRLISALAQ